MSHVNILFAEDFGAFREFASRELHQRPDFRVVTVSDGLAAVHKAESLRPDLVLLDISLPKLNGLAAARHIRWLSPESRILFLSQESSPDIVHEALDIGSLGYIVKARAGYLLPVVEAVLDGKPAAASGSAVGGAQHPVHHGHLAHFCTDDTTSLEAAEHFLGAALTRHDAAIAVATRPHLQQLVERLRTRGNYLDQAIEQGSFICLDAVELASHMLTDGVAAWRPSLVQTIESAAAATMRLQPRVAVVGECAAILWAAGHVDTAIALEQLGIEVANTRPVDIMCTYPLLPVNHARGFETVCAHHGSIVIR
jgi:DNA-binding NarL/FixJ family response regulator